MTLEAELELAQASGATAEAVPMRRDRPRWHVDAKWASGLLLFLWLSGLLPLAGLYRATREEVIVPALGQVFARLISFGRGNDSGLPATPEELARALYGGGLDGLEQALPLSTQLPPEMGPLGLLSAEGHRRVGRALLVAAIPLALLTSAACYFSAGLGRLGTPGVALLFASGPSLLAALLASRATAGLKELREPVGVLALLAHPLLAELARVLMAACLLSAALILTALVGHSGLRLLGGWRGSRRAVQAGHHPGPGLSAPPRGRASPSPGAYPE